MLRKLLVLLLMLMPNAVLAEDFVWQRFWTGHGWSYRKVVQPIVAETTIVNNLVGIPVPVQYTEPIAAQGTTVYGYQAISDYYNQVDMGLLYNQAARLADQAQQLAGQAALDHHTLVHAEGQYRAQIAQILAQGQVVRDALTAAKPETQAVITQRSFEFRVTQDANGDMRVEPVSTEQRSVDRYSGPNFNLIESNTQSTNSYTTGGTANIRAGKLSATEILRSKCVSCHNGAKVSGGLDFYRPLSPEMQQKIIDRVTTNDNSKIMPRKQDGSPGPRLSQQEVDTLTQAMKSISQK